MNKIEYDPNEFCALCKPKLEHKEDSYRCQNCITKGNMVGEVTWNLIEKIVEKSQERVIFMLTGLPAVFLEGIVRETPRDRTIGRANQIRIVFNPDVDNQLQITEPACASTKSAVYWRHNTEANVILFAPPDIEREAIGAGLGPVFRLDSKVIIENIDAWLDLLKREIDAEEYTKKMLIGLKDSQIYVDLEMWVEFILSINNQNSGTIYERIQLAAPALHIPIDGITKLPQYVGDWNQRITHQNFCSAFQLARTKVRPYAYLYTPLQEPVNINDVRKNIEQFDHQNDEKIKYALSVVNQLLNDVDNISKGDWQDSQKNFCEHVSWDKIGSQLFSGDRKANQESLGQKTLKFIQEKFPDDLSNDDQILLQTLPKSIPKEPSEDEMEFFERWQDKLNQSSSIQIYKAWQRRLFRKKEIIRNDLQSTIFDGLEFLIIEGSEEFPKMRNPRILIRVAQHNSIEYWDSINLRVLELFKFEYQILRGVSKDLLIWEVDVSLEVEQPEVKSRSTKKIKNPKLKKNKELRNVELDLYLMEYEEIANLKDNEQPPATVPNMRVIWQPGLKKNSETISLALTMDLAELKQAHLIGGSIFRKQKISPLSSGYGSLIKSMTLNETVTFNDVNREQKGQTFFNETQPDEDILLDLAQSVQNLVDTNIIDHSEGKIVLAAIESFKNAYIEAILMIIDDPETAFKSDKIDIQATAFGSLCDLCSRLARSNDRIMQEIHPIISEIGVVHSQGQDLVAILTAWHPLRLAERKSKVQELIQFIETILTSENTRNSDLTIAFESRRNILCNQWVYPECVVIGEQTMISKESVQGYSLMIPATSIESSQDSLEKKAASAADKFMYGINEFLELHPHKSMNLTVSIFDSTSQLLPKEIARLLNQKIQSDPNLKCELILTHYNQELMREIYRKQNELIQLENSGIFDQGFLSRLRIIVRPNPTIEIEDSQSEQVDDVKDTDIILLYDNVSNISKPQWKTENGVADDFDNKFSLSTARKPRKCLSNASSQDAGTYITINRPPKAVAQFYNLLFEQVKKVALPEKFHGVFVRDIHYDNESVKKLINQSHELAEWVISYDNISCRSLLEEHKIKIIRDISLPNSEDRVIISAKKINKKLKLLIQNEIVKSCGVERPESEILCDQIFDDVNQISGQKMLPAAQYNNSSSEIIGLSLMRHHMEASLPIFGGDISDTIWISLDDYRSWLNSGKGKVADAVGVTIIDKMDNFEIFLQVGEAKFVNMQSAQKETTNAKAQVLNSLNHLRELFIDNNDEVTRIAWCELFCKLLVNREGLVNSIPRPKRRVNFIEQLNCGLVNFHIRGEVVICVNDDHNSSFQLETDQINSFIRQQILTTPTIRNSLRLIQKKKQLDYAGLKNINWYSGEVIQMDSDKNYTGNNSISEKNEFQENTELNETNESKNFRNDENQNIVSDSSTKESKSVESVDTSANTSIKRPQFLPEPLFDELKKMTKRETNAVSDKESVIWAQDISKKIQRALNYFGMQAHFTEKEPQLLPNGALISFKGHSTLTIEKVLKKKSELLTTYAIEVSDVRPGKGIISIFVKRSSRATVPLASTWLGARWPDRQVGVLSNFILGAREDEDQLLYLNLSDNFGGYQEHGPHTLIAGETGSGKGVLIQGLLLQLIAFNDPKLCNLIVIDPKKGVDFAWLNETPHLHQGIVTEVEDAQSVFNNLVIEMDNRYKMLKEAGSDNISHYNQNRSSDEQMPRIFLIHDELGSWMAQEPDYQDTVISAVSNLGMKARAAGIHLILVTQYAKADAIPTGLRSNMGNRLCLKVQDRIGSRLVLDENGAENLLGKGHLAAKLANEYTPPGQKFFIVQVPYAKIDDISRLAEIAKSYWRS